jgi:hypothetical protein
MNKLGTAFLNEVIETWAPRANRVAEELREDLEMESKLAPFNAHRFDGQLGSVPVLHLEDVTGIPFVSDIPGVEEYQHRARVRAGTGDVFVAVTEPVEGYEAYCRRVLGLGAPAFVKPEPVDSPMAVANACSSGDAFEHLAAFGHRRGGLILHPYMAIESVWELASRLQDRHVSVQVIGPPPPALWIANDKSSLADIVDRLADSAWNVETHAETSPEALTQRLRDMSSRHRRIGLKRTRCASAMGNTVFNGESVASLDPTDVKRDVLEFLESTEWQEGEPVLAVEWADTDDSPSTQLWIPPHGDGAPRLDGVYEQILKGEERIFVGSRPSTLPARVDRALVEASMAMALVFQRLGYVGRCSFDFIVTGDLEADFDIKMTECNGRWGGTSTPMSLVDRLIKGERPDYVAQDYVHPELEGAAFSDVLDATRDELFDPSTGDGRFVFYNVGPLESRGKLDVISLGETPEEALEGVEAILPDLLGLE